MEDKMPYYSRDVIDDLKAISCCRQEYGADNGCNVCPFRKDKPEGRKCNSYIRLVDSIEVILEQFPEKQAEHLLSIIRECSLCEEYDCLGCQYYDESIENHEDVFYQHVYDFFKEQGLYNEDGTVSDKGARIRVSDTLALLMATGLTKESWKEERGGIII